jgi:hypothetical protein
MSNIEECKNIFVSWLWMVGIIAAFAGCAGGLTWVYASQQTAQDNRITKCESFSDKMVNDLDTVKTLLRRQYE